MSAYQVAWSILSTEALSLVQGVCCLQVTRYALLGHQTCGLHVFTQARCYLQVIRRICTAKSSALEPHWAALLPSLCSLAQDTAGPTKMATDKTLARMLELDEGSDKAQQFLSTPQSGSLVRGYLSEAKLRALSKLPQDADDDV